MPKYIYYFRKTLFLSLTLIFYILFIYNFFFLENWFYGFSFFVLFFIVFHNFYIELQEYQSRYFYSIIIVAFFVLSFIMGYENLFKIFSLLLFHIGLLLFTSNIIDEVSNKKRISIYNVLTEGVRSISMLMALSSAFLFIAIYSEFNLTCEQIDSYTENTISSIVNPFDLNLSDLGFDNYIEYFFNSDKLNNLVGSTNSVSDGVQKFIETGNISTGSNIDKFQQSINLKVLADRKEINQSVCSMLTTEIKKRYDDPRFNFSVAFLIFLLLRPFLKLVLYIVSLIYTVIFKIFLLIGFYRYGVITEENDSLE